MSKVIYTAIFGDKDIPPSVVRKAGFEYRIFTDNPELRSDLFEFIVCSPRYQDPTRDARYYKTCSHEVLPHHEYSLWIDANIRIGDIDMDALFNDYLRSHDVAVHAHPKRDCIYEEADVCIQIGKDDPAVIRHQMDNYRSQGYPENNRLVASGIIFRRHTPAITRLNDLWWQEIATYSRRDQLSFNYAAWKTATDYYIIDGFVGNGNVNGFAIHPHKKGDFRNW